MWENYLERKNWKNHKCIFLLLFNDIKFGKSSFFYSNLRKAFTKEEKKRANDFFIDVLLHFYDLFNKKLVV